MASQNVIKRSRTLIIGRVNPRDVVTQLCNGKYAEATLTPRAKTEEIEQDDGMKKTFFSRNIWSATGVRDNVLFVSCNLKIHEQVLTNPKDCYAGGGHCYYCHEDFKHRGMGIPVEMTRMEVEDEPDARVGPESTAVRYRVDMIDIVCGFQCALAHYFVISKQDDIRHFTKDSFSLLSILYKIQYPGHVLRAAQNFRLHERVGGPLNQERFWDGGMNTFKLTANLVGRPVRNMFTTMPNEHEETPAPATKRHKK